MRLRLFVERRRQELAARRLRKGGDFFRADIRHDGQVKERAHRRAHSLVAEDIDRALRQDDAVGADRIGRADDRARIAGVLHAVEHDEQRFPCRSLLQMLCHLRQAFLLLLRDEEDALRRICRSDLLC